ncbi:hypothetical protein HPB51_017410 [Rhipicephalus microplus]|uniref:UBA domain-containing protein n=1 Tax=Rhipicephalus microplus TaxID=6941 RepID=A0A9J6DAS3_RHIMP|nr:hypothetical protein HPB51_017410 [Rhipicephalus microplus]
MYWRLRGGSNKEAALFCRLHLLQGIVAFHQEHYPQARQYLQKAATLISQLKLHDSKLAQVMAMGFSESDSRLALRSVRGDVDLAVQHIITRQDEKKAQQEKEQEKRKLELRKRRLGKTCTGEWVSVENYDALKAMGFPATNARHALQRANNDINVAIQDTAPTRKSVLDELIGDTHDLGCTHQHILFPNSSHIQVPGRDSSDVAGNCGASVLVVEHFPNV